MDSRSQGVEGIRTLEEVSRLPRLAIMGRPNVGKSTLFNRLVRSRKAIVDNLPGVTRDRNYAEAEWYGKKFLLIDTGGFDPDPETPLDKQIQDQTQLAIEEADVILFLLDGKGGLNPLDREAAGKLRRVKKPVYFAVNKVDVPAKEALLYEFHALGVNEILPLSAEHGLGLTELMDRVVDSFPNAVAPGEGEEKGLLSLAIVGRPNVGKSTLVNRLLGYQRSIVDSNPGTTRDAVGDTFTWRGERYDLVDTAGIRRKAKISERLERYSVIRSLGSVDRGNVVIFLLDGPEGVTSQDAQILAYAFRRGKGLILAVNKWDCMAEDSRNKEIYGQALTQRLSFLDFAPYVFISAITGSGVEEMLDWIQKVRKSNEQRIPTAKLNEALEEITKRHPPPSHRGRQVKFYYGTQTGICPPTFTFFVNFPQGIAPSYERYLVHQLRQAFDLYYAPIRIGLRSRHVSKRRAAP